jgi:phosphoribosylanthranilate isomerase
MHRPVQVKICGITNLDDALAAVEAGAAALGFNFSPHSPRRITVEVAAEIIARLPQSICTVGVFVNQDREAVANIADRVRLTALQFHGDEPPSFCKSWPQKVIKAIRVRDHTAASLAHSYSVDFILADAYVEGQFGGTGIRIAAGLLDGFDRSRLILAGGLTPETVTEAVHMIRPAGVDVASGIERSPGRKDWDLMRRFISHAHAA